MATLADTWGRVEGSRVRLTVRAVRPRGLSLEAGQAWRLRLVLAGRAIAWGRAAPSGSGIAWVRAEGAPKLAIVPPIRATEARALRTSEAWTAFFAKALLASTRSPLRPGKWELAWLSPRPTLAESAQRASVDEYLDQGETLCRARNLLTALEAPRALFSSWFSFGAGRVLPLRDPSSSDAARVKAFRKHARDGTLPPVLLWWVSPLDGYLVLDGHDRLLAARLEGVRPSVLALHGSMEEPADPTWGETETKRYERAFANEVALSPRTRLEKNAALVRAFGGGTYTWTPAVARSDLAARFTEELKDLALEGPAPAGQAIRAALLL